MRSFSKIEVHKKDIERLYLEGKTIRDISAELALSKSTVGDYIRFLGISRSDFRGKNNPFYGKKHSQAVLDKISRSNTGRACAAKGHSKYPATKYISGLLINKWKVEAKKRDISWDISDEELDTLWETQAGRCALTGREMSGQWDGTRLTRVSLDRISSSGCYNVSNCQLVLGFVNVCKHILDNSEFLKLCEEVVSHVKSKKT